MDPIYPSPKMPKESATSLYLANKASVAIFIGAFLIIGTGTMLIAFHWKQLHQIHQGIPAQPQLDRSPQAFHDALTHANHMARANSKTQALEGLEQLGKLYHSNGFYDEASQCWRTLCKIQPRSAMWYYYLADALRLAGDESSTGPLLKTCAALQPDYAPGWLKWGTFEFAAGRHESAETCFSKRLEIMPSDSYAAVGLARICLQQNKNDTAIQWLQKAITGKPDLPTSHNLLARLLAESGDEAGADQQRWLGTSAGRYREAPDPWLENLNDYCYDIDHLLMLGSVDYQTLYRDHGLRYFERALSLNPENPEALEALGRIYLDEKNFEKARIIFEKAILLPEASATVYVRLSDALRQLERLPEALAVTQLGLGKKPEDPDLQNAMGTIYDAMGRYQEAITAFQATMIDVEHSAEANLNIALVKEHQGKKEEAIEYLHRALAIRPQYPQAQAELGVLELDAWRLDSAATYILEFYNNYPGSMRARELMSQLSVRRAITAVREGNLTVAEQMCLDGLKINPQSSDLNSFLGVLYAQQKRFEDAVYLLELARQVKPADPRILMNLAQVYADQGNLANARWVLSDGERRLRESGDVVASSQLKRMLQQLANGPVK